MTGAEGSGGYCCVPSYNFVGNGTIFAFIHQLGKESDFTWQKPDLEGRSKLLAGEFSPLKPMQAWLIFGQVWGYWPAFWGSGICGNHLVGHSRHFLTVALWAPLDNSFNELPLCVPD